MTKPSPLADHIASSRSTLTCYGGEGVKVPARLKVQA